MHFIEDQKSELDALTEIYYNEIQIRSNEPPISFSIKVRPQASYYGESSLDEDGDDSDDDCHQDDDDDDDDVEAADDDSDDYGSESSGQEHDKQDCPWVELLFKLPQDYPNSKPKITLLNSGNLEEFELTELIDSLDKKASEYVGDVMIFMLVSDVVEWLSTNAERESQVREFERAAKLRAIEAEEKQKCEGTAVTPETFLAWKSNFDAELLRVKVEESKKLVEQSGASGQRRLTGREMFERDKALAESDLNFVDELELEELMKNVDDIGFGAYKFEEDLSDYSD